MQLQKVVVWMRPYLQLLWSQVLPPLCLNCEEFLTERAETGLHAPLCQACERRLAWCAHIPLAYPRELNKLSYKAELLCLGLYEGSLREIILAAKWGKREPLATLLAHWAIELLKESGWLCDSSGKPPHGIMVIPRDISRSLRLGPSLAEIIAPIISSKTGIPIFPPLKRQKRPSQAGLRRSQRIRNLNGVFSLRKCHQRNLKAHRILVVDDVLTTGATLREYVRCLHSAQPEEIKLLTLARVRE